MEIKAPSLMYPEDQKQLAAMLRSGGTVTVHPSPPQDASLLRDFLASTASAWLRGHWSGPFANAPVATLGPRFQQALAEQAPSIPPAQQVDYQRYWSARWVEQSQGPGLVCSCKPLLRLRTHTLRC
jgi:hypothetical protein